MSCNATGNPIPTLSWFYENQTLYSSSTTSLSNDFRSSEQCALDNDSNSIEVTFGQNQQNIKGILRYKCSYSIQIELHLNKWPIGLHRFDCIASNTHGQQKSAIFVKNVLKPAFIEKNNTLIDIRMGLSIDLKCDYTQAYPPVDEIIWKKVCSLKIKLKTIILCI